MSEQSIFENLNKLQIEQLEEAIPLITILIAGADDSIDEHELNWAEKLTHIRTYANPEDLNEFYSKVEGKFMDEINRLRNELPTELKKRQDQINKKLGRLNDILPLLTNSVAFQLYESLTSFAEHIAKSSGGFLRFGSVSREERSWIKLPMIDPILYEEEPGVF